MATIPTRHRARPAAGHPRRSRRCVTCGRPRATQRQAVPRRGTPRPHRSRCRRRPRSDRDRRPRGTDVSPSTTPGDPAARRCEAQPGGAAVGRAPHRGATVEGRLDHASESSIGMIQAMSGSAGWTTIGNPASWNLLRADPAGPTRRHARRVQIHVVEPKRLWSQRTSGLVRFMESAWGSAPASHSSGEPRPGVPAVHRFEHAARLDRQQEAVWGPGSTSTEWSLGRRESRPRRERSTRRRRESGAVPRRATRCSRHPWIGRAPSATSRSTRSGTPRRAPASARRPD